MLPANAGKKEANHCLFIRPSPNSYNASKERNFKIILSISWFWNVVSESVTYVRELPHGQEQCLKFSATKMVAKVRCGNFVV